MKHILQMFMDSQGLFDLVQKIGFAKKVSIRLLPEESPEIFDDNTYNIVLPTGRNVDSSSRMTHNLSSYDVALSLMQRFPNDGWETSAWYKNFGNSSPTYMSDLQEIIIKPLRIFTTLSTLKNDQADEIVCIFASFIESLMTWQRTDNDAKAVWFSFIDLTAKYGISSLYAHLILRIFKSFEPQMCKHCVDNEPGFQYSSTDFTEISEWLDSPEIYENCFGKMKSGLTVLYFIENPQTTCVQKDKLLERIRTDIVISYLRHNSTDQFQ